MLFTVFIYVLIMPHYFLPDFTHEFETTRECSEFYKRNAEGVPDGYVMGIPYNSACVRITPVETETFVRAKRPNNGIWGNYGSDDLKAGVNGLINHADGKRYDSKNEFRKATQRAGCVEIGNEKPKNWQPPIQRGIRGDYNVRSALKDALHQHGVK